MSDNTKYRAHCLLLGSVLLAACSQSLQQGSSDAPLQPRIEPENWPMQASPIARSAAIERKVSALLSQMSTEQKVGQIIQADIASVTRDRDGTVIAGSLDDAIESRDVWTFSRNVTARDPNWLLDETDEG